MSEKGLIVETNLTLATLLGTSRSELVNQPLSRFILPEDQDIYYRHRNQLFATETPQISELRLLRQDGMPLWARLEAMASRDEENGALVCRIAVSDITDRRQADDALQRSEELFRVTIENLIDPVLITDNDGKFTFIGPNVPDILGYSMEEIQAKGTIDRLVGENLFRPETLESEKSIINIESSVADNYGRKRLFLITVKLVSIGDGTRLYIMRDITKLKRAEEGLQEQVKKLNCLYGISALFELPGLTLDERLQRAAKLLPSAWRLSNIAAASIVLDGRSFPTPLFRNSPWMQAGEITIQGKPAGQVLISYLEQPPTRNGGPFLPEEQQLLKTIAEILGRKIELQRTEEQLKTQLEELTRWHNVMLGREDRVQELKREVNELCRRASEPTRYPSQESGAESVSYVDQTRQLNSNS